MERLCRKKGRVVQKRNKIKKAARLLAAFTKYIQYELI